METTFFPGFCLKEYSPVLWIPHSFGNLKNQQGSCIPGSSGWVVNRMVCQWLLAPTRMESPQFCLRGRTEGKSCKIFLGEVIIKLSPIQDAKAKIYKRSSAWFVTIKWAIHMAVLDSHAERESCGSRRPTSWQVVVWDQEAYVFGRWIMLRAYIKPFCRCLKKSNQF